MPHPPGTEVDLRPIKRIAAALYAAGERGESRKHNLMLRAAAAVCDVEYLLVIIHQAMERGDIALVKMRLRDIAKILGCENIVMNAVDIAQYNKESKHDTAQNGN